MLEYGTRELIKLVSIDNKGSHLVVLVDAMYIVMRRNLLHTQTF